jgi:hypothetical protein
MFSLKRAINIILAVSVVDFGGRSAVGVESTLPKNKILPVLADIMII